MKALLERVQTVADHPIDAINQYVDQGKKSDGDGFAHRTDGIS